MKPNEDIHIQPNNNLASNFMILLPCALTVFCLWISRRIWNTSLTLQSHAVSRRRKFYRDPIRRPILIHHKPSTPSIQSPGSNEAFEYSPRKKLTTREEFLNMPGGRRNILRAGNRIQLPPLLNDESQARLLSLQHLSLPELPEIRKINFEIIMCLFTCMATSLQFLHLYRTVWWLPQSYTQYKMNFYLIDPYLAGFIGTILVRRVIYCILAQILSNWSYSSIWPSLQQMLRLFLLTIVMLSLMFCTYNILKNHPIMRICYLCYPMTVYFMFFGLSISPFFDVDALPPSKDHNTTKYGIGQPVHICSKSSKEIREEVEIMKINFNNRMKQILFSSVLNAYYSSFVPCCFAQNHLYYDAYWATQHLVFVWLGCFTMYIVYCYPLKYCDVLHRAALHLGRWNRIEGRNTHIPTHTWTNSTLWHHGVLVKHSRELYKAEGICNAAEPGNHTHSRFYAVFNNPSMLICSFLGLQLLLVIFQLVVLIGSTEWYHTISISLLLFPNYYTLFKFGRDFMVSWKIYKVEKTIQVKHSSTG